MIQFHLDSDSALRLLRNAAWVLSQVEPPAGRRLAAYLELAERLGYVGEQVLLEAFLEPSASRSEAEATYLATVALLTQSKLRRAELEALGTLGGTLDLGLAAKELQRLGKQPDALEAVRLKGAATRRRSKPSSEPEQRAPDPGKREPDVSDSDIAPILREPRSGALPVALRTAIAVLVLGGLGVGAFVLSRPSEAERAARAQEAQRASLERRLEQARGQAEELRGARGVRFETVGPLVGSLKAIEREATSLGDASLATQARDLAAAPHLKSALDEARATLREELRERVRAANDPGALSAILGGLPPVFLELEPTWCNAHFARLEAWKGLKADLDRFLQAPGEPGLSELKAAQRLLDRAEAAKLGETPDAATLKAWLRARSGWGERVLAEEIRLRRREEHDAADEVRRLLAGVEPSVTGFFAKRPDETGELFALLPPSAVRGFMTTYLSDPLWDALPARWFDAVQRVPARELPDVFNLVPKRKWVSAPRSALLQFLLSLETKVRLRCVLALSEECVQGFRPAEVWALIKDWPEHFQDLVLRLFPEDVQRSLRPERATETPGQGMVGTGFYVSERLLLTNRHVVGEAREVDVETFQGAERGRVIAVSQSEDLALVEVSRPGRPLQLAQTGNLRMVYAYGFGTLEGKANTLLSTGGRVASANEGRIVFAAHVNPGNSGGPLVDSEGRWVGVVVAKTVKTSTNEDSLGIAIHGERARAWLAEQGVVLRADPPSVSQDMPPDAIVRQATARIVVKASPAGASEPPPRDSAALNATTPEDAVRIYFQVLSRHKTPPALDGVMDYAAIARGFVERDPRAGTTTGESVRRSFFAQLEKPPERVLTLAQIDQSLRAAQTQIVGDEATLTLPGPLEFKLRLADGWRIVSFPY